MASENTARLAVLIDADNAQSTVVEGLLAEVAKYGTAQVKRAYGDWTGTSLKGWKDKLLTQSIQPVQQFAYTTGKNATDAAMVIDAMDRSSARSASWGTVAIGGTHGMAHFGTSGTVTCGSIPARRRDIRHRYQEAPVVVEHDGEAPGSTPPGRSHGTAPPLSRDALPSWLTTDNPGRTHKIN